LFDRQFSRQNFDDDRAAELLIDGFINRALSAGAQLVSDFVVPEELPNHRGRILVRNWHRGKWERQLLKRVLNRIQRSNRILAIHRTEMVGHLSLQLSIAIAPATDALSSDPDRNEMIDLAIRLCFPRSCLNLTMASVPGAVATG
jgi:hypothetical protein